MENYHKKMTILFATTLGVTLLMLGFSWYFMQDIKGQVKKINQYQLEIQNRNLLLDRINILERESQEAAQYKTLLQKALPSEIEIANFETIIKSLPSARNLNISFRFGTLEQTKENQPKSYGFNLIVSGTLNSLLNWLEEMYRLPYSFDFSQIEVTQISPVGDTSKNININNLQYKIQIIGNIYMR